MSWSTNIVGTVVALLVIILLRYRWRYQYWKKKGVPYPEPKAPYGNFNTPINPPEQVGETMKTIYLEMKRKGCRDCGLYSVATPNYMPIDLDYIKNIMTKDFQFFTDRGFYYNEKDDPLSAHLFALSGPKWRHLRTKLTPTFTSGKMKSMFQTLVDCETPLLEVMEKRHQQNGPIDIKEILRWFTTDIIGSCAFGLDCNTFKNENSPFRSYVKKVFAPSVWQVFKSIFGRNYPQLARKLKVTLTEPDVSEFFIKMVSDTVDYREKNKIVRNDFLQLLIQLKNNELDGEKGDGTTLTIGELAAQSFIFFAAGFETSSTTMTLALYEMARHEKVQEKVREEVERVVAKYGGKTTYEGVNEMKYLNQVVEETLRKYPSLPFLTRLCIKDYKIPDQNVIIEEGTRVIIPVLGLHYDEEYYKNPNEFDPERFNEENKKTRNQYAYLPFGEGPRMCIGMRFGMMQSKVGLAALLRKYRFTVNSKTQEPLKYDPKAFLPNMQGGVWLNAKKL